MAAYKCSTPGRECTFALIAGAMKVVNHQVIIWKVKCLYETWGVLYYNRHSPLSRMLDEQCRMPLNSSYTCRVICCTPPSTIATMDNCWNSSECGNRQWHNRLSQSDPINVSNKGVPKMMKIFALINRTCHLS